MVGRNSLCPFIHTVVVREGVNQVAVVHNIILLFICLFLRNVIGYYYFIKTYQRICEFENLGACSGRKHIERIVEKSSAYAR